MFPGARLTRGARCLITIRNHSSVSRKSQIGAKSAPLSNNARSHLGSDTLLVLASASSELNEFLGKPNELLDGLNTNDAQRGRAVYLTRAPPSAWR